jgi:hypothetical protein
MFKLDEESSFKEIKFKNGKTTISKRRSNKGKSQRRERRVQKWRNDEVEMAEEDRRRDWVWESDVPIDLNNNKDFRYYSQEAGFPRGR